MDLAEEYGSNAEAEINGVWVPVGVEAEVKVARLGNVEAQKAYRKIPRPIRRRIEEGYLNDKQAENFICDFLASHILKDWKNLSDGPKPIKYSSENAIKMLKKYRRFRDKIWELSAEEDLFNTSEVEQDAKN